MSNKSNSTNLLNFTDSCKIEINKKRDTLYKLSDENKRIKFKIAIYELLLKYCNISNNCWIIFNSIIFRYYNFITNCNCL